MSVKPEEIPTTPVVGSGHVEAVGYDVEQGIAVVVYKGSGRYHHMEVPAKLGFDLLESATNEEHSTGKFINAELKDRFTAEKYNPLEDAEASVKEPDANGYMEAKAAPHARTADDVEPVTRMNCSSCSSVGTVFYNPYNQVDQCHSCGYYENKGKPALIETPGDIPIPATEPEGIDLITFATSLDISVETASNLQRKFSLEIAPELLKEAYSIVVTDESQKDLMQKAHELRMKFKSERNRIEKVRVLEKRESLRKGQAIDQVAKYLERQLSAPEGHLQLQEDFIKIKETARLDALELERLTALAPYVADQTIRYDLRNMSQEGFDHLLETSRLAHEAKQQEISDREAARIAEEKRQQEETHRLRAENLRLASERAEEERKRLEAEALERQERVERQKAEADLRAILDKEEADKRRIELEAEAAKMAPDKEKLLALVAVFEAINLPTLESEAANNVLAITESDLWNMTRRLRSNAEAL